MNLDTKLDSNTSHSKTKKALVLGIANERSIAWGIAKQLHSQGFQIAATFLGDALERRVRPLAESIQADLIEPCDVEDDTQLDALFDKIKNHWGSLDAVIHSVAYAHREDLEGRFLQTSRAGFHKALGVSAYSLLAVAKRGAPLMPPEGGTFITLSYYGAEKVVPNYHVMGVAKAALEATVRYLAYDLGSQKIRVHAISAGPVKTLAASGIRQFKEMLAQSAQKTPLPELISSEDIGALAGFLCSDLGKHMTGGTLYVDSGAHIMAP